MLLLRSLALSCWHFEYSELSMLVITKLNLIFICVVFSKFLQLFHCFRFSHLLPALLVSLLRCVDALQLVGKSDEALLNHLLIHAPSAHLFLRMPLHVVLRELHGWLGDLIAAKVADESFPSVKTQISKSCTQDLVCDGRAALRVPICPGYVGDEGVALWTLVPGSAL